MDLNLSRQGMNRDPIFGSVLAHLCVGLHQHQSDSEDRDTSRASLTSVLSGAATNLRRGAVEVLRTNQIAVKAQLTADAWSSPYCCRIDVLQSRQYYRAAEEAGLTEVMHICG